jgi:uncharacterized integral membrane protein
MTLLSKLKWIFLIVAVLLLMIIAFQNLAEIEVRVLFWTGTLPQALVLTAAIAIGFVMGLLLQTLLRVRTWQHNRRE